MKTSIATVCISGDLREKLAAIASAGFDGVEIFENDFLAFDGTPAEVGRMIRDHGLEITLFQPFRDFEGMPEPQRSRNFDRAERKFDLMQELGTDLMLVCSNVSPLVDGKRSLVNLMDHIRPIEPGAAPVPPPMPASTPANVGIFEGLVVFTLNQFGLTDNAAILSYAIVYHLVVVTPQLFLGSLSVIRSNRELVGSG
jgi:hypothetical protein